MVVVAIVVVLTVVAIVAIVVVVATVVDAVAQPVITPHELPLHMLGSQALQLHAQKYPQVEPQKQLRFFRL